MTGVETLVIGECLITLLMHQVSSSSLASTVQYLNHHDKIRKRVGQMIVLSCWRGSVCMPLVDIGREARPNRHGVRLVRPEKSRVDLRAEIDINGTCGSGETKETTTPGTVDAPGISICHCFGLPMHCRCAPTPHHYSYRKWWI